MRTASGKKWEKAMLGTLENLRAGGVLLLTVTSGKSSPRLVAMGSVHHVGPRAPNKIAEAKQVQVRSVVCLYTENVFKEEEIDDLGVREQELQLGKHRMLLKRAVDHHTELPAQAVRHCRSLDYDLESMPEKLHHSECFASPQVAFAEAPRE